MNAIRVLQADHRAIVSLFRELKEMRGSASEDKKDAAAELVRVLSIHAAIEEQVFYPRVREEIDCAAELAAESLEEHNVMKWELAALQTMDPSDERYDAKLTVLREVALRHMKKEETLLFPLVRDAFGFVKLRALGAKLELAKKAAPTRPHPRAPDEPPANLLVGMATGVLDRGRDTARAVLRKSRAVSGRDPGPHARTAEPSVPKEESGKGRGAGKRRMSRAHAR
jgi:hemerythrin superfamily protein